MGFFGKFTDTKKCAQCFRPIEGFVWELDNKKYCQECYNRKMAITGQVGGRSPEEYDFEMTIEDVFLIRNHGVIVTGKIRRGVIHIHDTVTINNRNYTVTAIDVIPNQVAYAKEGAHAGLHLSSMDACLFKRGDVVISKRIPTGAAQPTGELLDDITFIREMKSISAGLWQQYDVLLAARGYGWEMVKDWADYMADADLEHISQVTTGALGIQEQDITQSYLHHDGRCAQTPELYTEMGILSVAGISKTLKAPMKIVWINQTQVLRFFTLVNDELQMRKYIETTIRRTFGTRDAMKLGKPIPKGQ